MKKLLSHIPSSLPCPVILRDTAGEKNKHDIQESITLLLCVLHRKIQGRCHGSDGGVNLYSQKFYEILSTPLLRNYRIFGVFPILLTQLPVIPRDTAGEKNKHDIQESITLLLCVLHRKIQGRCHGSDGGVNLYSQKFYEILSTPLLRNYRIFGVFPILLTQLPVIPRDTAGEKNKHDIWESITLLLCVLHSKIQGRWHEVTEGLNKYPQQRKHIKVSTLSLCSLQMK